jgi:hypothetical protein
VKTVLTGTSKMTLAIPRDYLRRWRLYGRDAQATATIARILRRNDYSTGWIGKNHNTPLWERNPAGRSISGRTPTGSRVRTFLWLCAQSRKWAPIFRNCTHAMVFCGIVSLLAPASAKATRGGRLSLFPACRKWHSSRHVTGGSVSGSPVANT